MLLVKNYVKWYICLIPKLQFVDFSRLPRNVELIHYMDCPLGAFIWSPDQVSLAPELNANNKKSS